MDAHRSAGPRSGNALLVRIIGVVMEMTFAIIAMMGITPPTMRGRVDGKPADGKSSADLEAARRRAIDWATPECRERLREAVVSAGTAREIEDAAWAACPDHPDALD